ncbi:putative transporter [Lachnellula suecica]|uniref:Putative transporter n=1 Tax=Lachnellula suecica TaxID=602035 RepID=A0A8T9C2V3_9HELO|nr:putative transporter [Lachnellula suecica]
MDLPDEKSHDPIVHSEVEKHAYPEQFNSPGSDKTIDEAAEKALLWKIDLHVVPPLAILFLLAFLDRVNIGNAKIQGMTKELNMEGQDYSIALFIFFIPYILLEVPSNLLLRKIKPSTWLCGIMFFWGVITIGQGLVKSFASLVVLRFLLGALEAGFAPGCVYLISMYYQRYELQWRMNVFFSASIMSGAFGGLFAYALAHMNGIGGYSGWRWIFIIEGLLTTVVAIGFKFIVVDWPETSSFLTTEERELLQKRLTRDTGEARMDTLNRQSAKRIFSDWKIYCGIFMYMGVVNTGYATSFFIPTIIQEMGYTAAMSQVRSIPIFIVATVAALTVAWLTDKLKHRYSFTMLGVLVGMIGYIILLCQNKVPVGVKYMACFFITTGGYITQPVTWVWLSNNVSGHYKRSVSAAMQIGIGNIGGIVASNIFIPKESPRYTTGYGVSLAMLLLCGLMCTGFFFGLRAENKKRGRGGRDYRFTDERAELGNMGDDFPSFRHTT